MSNNVPKRITLYLIKRGNAYKKTYYFTPRPSKYYPTCAKVIYIVEYLVNKKDTRRAVRFLMQLKKVVLKNSRSNNV